MEEDLGFEQITSDEMYYICCSNEDSNRVASIAQSLHDIGVPISYDYGVSRDYEKETSISKKIVECTALIFFLSKDIFSDVQAPIWIDYITAKNDNKNIYVLWLDVVTSSDVEARLKTIFSGISAQEGLNIAFNEWQPEEIAIRMVERFKLNYNTEKMVDCAFALLEKKSYTLAEKYCQSVIEKDPKYGKAYLGRMMARHSMRSMEDVVQCEETLVNNEDYISACRYADDELRYLLVGHNEIIQGQFEDTYKIKCYNYALKKKNRAIKETNPRERFKGFVEAIREFQKIIDYKDSAEFERYCLEQAEMARKETFYYEAKLYMGSDTIEGYEKAIAALDEITHGSGYMDANNLKEECRKKIKEIQDRRIGIILKSEAEEPGDTVVGTEGVWKAIAIVVAIIVILVFVLVLISSIIPKMKYSKAISRIDEGGYDAVKTILSESDQNEDSFRSDIEEHWLSKVEVGDLCAFGNYEQNNDLTDGKEIIDWLVLAVEENRVLLTSRYALDCRQYNDAIKSVKWESCALRKWLNGHFLKEAFSKDERTNILKVAINKDDVMEDASSMSDNVADSVFLLGISDIYTYLGSEDSRKCMLTAYADAQGAWSNSYNNDNRECWWWLRSLGYAKGYVMSIENDGSVNEYGNLADNNRIAIRPALWLKKESKVQ